MHCVVCYVRLTKLADVYCSNCFLFALIASFRRESFFFFFFVPVSGFGTSPKRVPVQQCGVVEDCFVCSSLSLAASPALSA